ncbi:hypothetical protein Tco_1142910 [Tanacetum coccineum]
MEVPDAMISDAIKKKAGYTYYMIMIVEIANVPNKLMKDVVPRKTRSLTITEEAVVDIDSDATLYSSSSDKTEESANKTEDADYSDMDLSDDSPHGDDAAVMSYDNQDPPNNHEEENKKKRRKDVGEPSSRLSRKHPYPKWFPKKSGLAKRRTTWFGVLLKSDIDKNENHILGPSTIAIVKKFKELIQKDELTIADLEGAGLEWLKVQYQNDVELEYHVSQLKTAVFTEANMEEKYTTSITKHYAARYYKQGIEDMIPGRWCKETHRYIFEALNGIDQKIPFTMFRTHRGVVYLPQHNIKSFMKLSEVKKFYDDTLIKIYKNLVDMVKRNKLGSGNKRLKGRD